MQDWNGGKCLTVPVTVGWGGKGCVRSVDGSRDDDWAGVAGVRPVEAPVVAGVIQPGENKQVLAVKLIVILTLHNLSVQPPQMAGHPKRDRLG